MEEVGPLLISEVLVFFIGGDMYMQPAREVVHSDATELSGNAANTGHFGWISLPFTH